MCVLSAGSELLTQRASDLEPGRPQMLGQMSSRQVRWLVIPAQFESARESHSSEQANDKVQPGPVRHTMGPGIPAENQQLAWEPAHTQSQTNTQSMAAYGTEGQSYSLFGAEGSTMPAGSMTMAVPVASVTIS